MIIKKKIDELGRIHIPKFIRDNLDIKCNDSVEIEILDNKIIIKKTNN